MNNELRQKIVELRKALSEIDDAPRYGDIRPGNQHAVCEVESWRGVLAECDGGRFGAIDIWSSQELSSYQEVELLPEDQQDQLIVGQILYEPVAIHRMTGLLSWLPLGGTAVLLGNAEHFLDYFVFGLGYGELVPDVEDEPWWRFLEGATKE